MPAPAPKTEIPQAMTITDEYVSDVIARTNHIGKKISEGVPNNSSESTVGGMANALHLLLKGYTSGQKLA